MTDYISRADAMGAVQDHFNADGFKGYDDGQKMMDRINALPSADAVSREEYEETDGVVKIEKQNANEVGEIKHIVIHSPNYTRYFYNESMPTSADAVQGEWIPCSEKLPSEDEIVNITWVNHNPPPYYADIAEKPFVASGLRYRDKWYWYSSVCQDLHQDFDLIDKDIEVIAWQPLPTPYKGGDTE